MSYHYKKNSILIQGGFGILFFLVSLAFGDWLVAAVGGLLAFMLVRDCMKLKETRYEVKKDRFEMYVNGVLKQSIRWNNFEYVTRTRKNSKWVVVGRINDQIVLKPSLENFDELVKEILAHLKDNKEVYVHDNIIKKLK